MQGERSPHSNYREEVKIQTPKVTSLGEKYYSQLYSQKAAQSEHGSSRGLPNISELYKNQHKKIVTEDVLRNSMRILLNTKRREEEMQG